MTEAIVFLILHVCLTLYIGRLAYKEHKELTGYNVCIAMRNRTPDSLNDIESHLLEQVAKKAWALMWLFSAITFMNTVNVLDQCFKLFLMLGGK